jgi:beta-glucosidase
VSDWGAQHSGLSSAENGLDMAMPNSAYWQKGNLSLMVTNGSLEQSRLDDMAMRIVTPYFRFAHFEPGTGMPANLLAPHELVDARDPESDKALLQGAIEGHVLVKNTNNALPLKKPKVLSVFGYDAAAPARNTPTGGLFNRWGFGMENTLTVPVLGFFNSTYLGRLFLSNEPYGAPVPGASYNGTLITGGGSGAVTPAFIDAPLDALQRKARADRSIIYWDTESFSPTVNPASEVCLVFVNELASEGWDRPNIVSPKSTPQPKKSNPTNTTPSRPTQPPTTSSSPSHPNAPTPKS